MNFVTPVEESPFHSNAADHIKWSILKQASHEALTVDGKRQELLAHTLLSTVSKDYKPGANDNDN